MPEDVDREGPIVSGCFPFSISIPVRSTAGSAAADWELVFPSLTVLGIDGRFAPCGILAELHVGDQVLPTDTSWKVKAAFKDDPLPESLDNEANAVILAPFGARPWGREIRVFSEP